MALPPACRAATETAAELLEKAGDVAMSEATVADCAEPPPTTAASRNHDLTVFSDRRSLQHWALPIRASTCPSCWPPPAFCKKKRRVLGLTAREQTRASVDAGSSKSKRTISAGQQVRVTGSGSGWIGKVKAWRTEQLAVLNASARESGDTPAMVFARGRG